jgi:hypothetical protein
MKWMPMKRSGRSVAEARRVLALICGVLVGFQGLAAANEAIIASVYHRQSINPPSDTGMTVCYGFVCRRRYEIDFAGSGQKALSAILAAGKASPEAERAAVAKAVAWFDRRVGPLIGTSRRVARADFRNGDDAGNFDCIDTSTNITSLLLLLSKWKLLRHHSVSATRFRGNLLFGQTPHNTAVLIASGTGRGWAVDMWTTRYGAPAEVKPIEQWLQEN